MSCHFSLCWSDTKNHIICRMMFILYKAGMLWNVSCSQLGHVVRVFSEWVQSKSSTVSHFVLYSVFCGCDRSRHLSHPAADRPHHCCDSGLLQAQEESRERKPPTAECGPLNAHTSLLKNAVWLKWTLSCKDSRRAKPIKFSIQVSNTWMNPSYSFCETTSECVRHRISFFVTSCCRK